jgi:hypothetical protein
VRQQQNRGAPRRGAPLLALLRPEPAILGSAPTRRCQGTRDNAGAPVVGRGRVQFDCDMFNTLSGMRVVDVFVRVVVGAEIVPEMG